MESRALNGFDNVYIPIREVKNMAGRRPMYDQYVQRAIVAWSVHFPAQPFTASELRNFMQINKMHLTQSRGSLTVPVIANRLAFWEKKGMFGLIRLSNNPHIYTVKEEEE